MALSDLFLWNRGIGLDGLWEDVFVRPPVSVIFAIRIIGVLV